MTLRTALDVLNGPLPRWCRSYGVYPKQYDNIDKWYNSDNHNKNYLRRFDMEVKRLGKSGFEYRSRITLFCYAD